MILLADQASTSLLSALGIDWRTLALQAAAFLVVAWVAEKFIYPPLIKALDAKRREFEDAEKLKRAAEQALAEAHASAAKIMSLAFADAHTVRTGADQEAAELMQAARDKATAQARRLVDESHHQLERDVAAARRDLKKDTAELAALAAGVILKRKLTASQDAALIGRSLETKP